MAEWYQTPLGQYLFDELQEKLEPVLSTSFGYYALQIGSLGESQVLLEACRVKHKFVLDRMTVAADLQAYASLLPVTSDSVDLVVIVHRLSNTQTPHALLREAARILIPEGRLIIIDFNPLSFWGIRHFFQAWLEQIPWSGHYYSARRLTDWMKLLGFDRQQYLRVGYLPPIQRPRLLSYLSWLEKGMRKWLRFSSALNVLIYNKNVIPMTAVRQRWSARSILPGNVARPTVGRGMKYDGEA